jgi:hypothetical protein
VGEFPEDLSPVDPVAGEVNRFGWPGASLDWGELAGRTVPTGGVVVPQVLGQRPARMVLVDDQQLVEELPPEDPDHPFADGVRSGRLRRAAEDPDSFRREHGVEGTGELARAIPDQELD